MKKRRLVVFVLIPSILLGGGWFYCWYTNKPTVDVINLNSEIAIANEQLLELQCIIDEQSADILLYADNLERVAEEKTSITQQSNIYKSKLDSIRENIRIIQDEKYTPKELDAYALDQHFRDRYSQ